MAKKYEGSAEDVRKDKAAAKKRGLTMAQWERTAADKKMDRAGQKRFNRKKKK